MRGDATWRRAASRSARTQLIGELPNRGEGGRVSVVVGGETRSCCLPVRRRRGAGRHRARPVGRRRDGRGLVRAGRQARWHRAASTRRCARRRARAVRAIRRRQGDPGCSRRACAGFSETRTAGDPQSANVPWHHRARVTPAAGRAGQVAVLQAQGLRHRAGDDRAARGDLGGPRPAGGRRHGSSWGSVTPQLAEDGQTAPSIRRSSCHSDGILLLTLPADLAARRRQLRPPRSGGCAASPGALCRCGQPAAATGAAGPWRRGSVQRAEPAGGRRGGVRSSVIADNVVLARKPATNLLVARLGPRWRARRSPRPSLRDPTGWSADHPLAENMHWSAAR